MKHFRFTAGVVFILAVSASIGLADYRFDDLYGPSGISGQWMILNDAHDTWGASHTTAIDVSGDLLSDTDAVLNVLSGNADNLPDDRTLDTMFFVAADGEGDFTMNFRAPDPQQWDIATPNLQLSTPFSEELTINEAWGDVKTPAGTPEGYDALWKSYNFHITRNDRQTYNTVAQYFYFQQNPRYSSSLGIPRPFVIANVSSGTASDAPLELRMTLRDASSNGNIVAYDADLWAMDDSLSLGGSDWVFVPVNDFNTKRANYYLTTEVANHCSVRYAAYNSSGGLQTNIYPNSWKFDLPRVQGTTNITREFDLSPASHIAPGLVTIYRRPFQLGEADKRPLTLYPVDDNRQTGVYPLVLNHRLIFGKALGDTHKEKGSGGVNMFEVTAFEFQPASMNFLDKLANVTAALGTVAMPSSQIFTSAAITRDPSVVPSTALQYFTIDQNIPANLRTNSQEGILPLHITFNIPVTSLGAEAWNDVLRAWRSNMGYITQAFANHYHLYLLSDDGNTKRLWNLTQEMEKYPGQIKVYLDEERGTITRDNDRGVITVSFIVMLMDGTRDGVRPELSTVSDNTNTASAEYVVVRDGKFDNKWHMTFFVAPADYSINPEKTEQPVQPGTNSSSSGGGGCNAGIYGLLAALTLFIYRKGD